jgi:hypothetical protein
MLACVSIITLNAQTAQSTGPKSVPLNLYERVLTIVPMVGTGKWDDPKRPLFVPAKAPLPTDRTGLLGYSYQISDDGKFALVEFVALDKSVLKAITTDARVMKSFEKGQTNLSDVSVEFQKYKKDFNWQHFGTRVQ